MTNTSRKDTLEVLKSIDREIKHLRADIDVALAKMYENEADDFDIVDAEWRLAELRRRRDKLRMTMALA